MSVSFLRDSTTSRTEAQILKFPPEKATMDKVMKQGKRNIRKNENKKNKKFSAAKEKNNSKQIDNTDVVELTSPGTSNERRSAILIGDSIISKISGWKMSDKSNKISVRAFSGSKVEHVAHYIKSTLNTWPDSVILWHK